MQDNNYLYKENDVSPRKDFDVLPSRIKELATSKNRRGEPLIKEIEEEKSKKIDKKVGKIKERRLYYGMLKL